MRASASGRSISSISFASGKVSFAVTDDRGRALPLYRDGQNYYLSANDGQSYQLEIQQQQICRLLKLSPA